MRHDSGVSGIAERRIGELRADVGVSTSTKAVSWNSIRRFGSRKQDDNHDPGKEQSGAEGSA